MYNAAIVPSPYITTGFSLLSCHKCHPEKPSLHESTLPEFFNISPFSNLNCLFRFEQFSSAQTCTAFFRGYGVMEFKKKYSTYVLEFW